jgi:hypothetical protein
MGADRSQSTITYQGIGCRLLQASIAVPVDRSRQQSLKLRSVLHIAQDGVWLDGRSSRKITRLGGSGVN